MVISYLSPDGFAGVCVSKGSTITMPPGSNTIEGNGKAGRAPAEQVVIDD